MSPITVGSKFISLRDELDSDENDEDRITPAGSLWRVTHLADKRDMSWSIVCDKTGGWINPNEAELAKDFRRISNFEYRVREEWPEVADKVLAIARGEMDPCEVPETDAWVRGCYNEPRVSEQKMHAIDVLIGGFGCEAIFGDSHTWPDMEYVNMGETYATTIVLDNISHKFLVTSWGAWIEDAEAKGRTYA